jgi:ATP-dependent RNA helicase DHX57
MEQVGRSVGYMIKGEACVSRDTRLLFCTNGVLLRRLQDDERLAGVTHVVVDEVHERNLDSDVLLVLLKRLAQSRPDFTLILMSATLDHERFAAYLDLGQGCHTLHIPGFTHPVQDLFLEDVLPLIDYEFRNSRKPGNRRGEKGEEGQSDGPQEQRALAIEELPKLDYELYGAVVVALLTGVVCGCRILWLIVPCSHFRSSATSRRCNSHIHVRQC